DRVVARHLLFLRRAALRAGALADELPGLALALHHADFVGPALVVVLRDVARLPRSERVVVARHVAAGRFASARAATRELLPLRIDAHERVALVGADLLHFF